MRTARSLTVCHARPPAMHAASPCTSPAMHAPCPHMPPATHASCHACPPPHHTWSPTIHTPLPAMHVPHHACPHHAHPLPHMLPPAMHAPPLRTAPPPPAMHAPHCGQNSWHTLKILPCPNFVAGGKYWHSRTILQVRDKLHMRSAMWTGCVWTEALSAVSPQCREICNWF